MFSYTFQWNQALNRLPQMLEGALVTMEVAILSMVLGIALAIMLTGFRLSGNRVLMGFATTWVEIARNTPALFQIYMAHFGVASFGIHFSPFASLADRHHLQQRGLSGRKFPRRAKGHSRYADPVCPVAGHDADCRPFAM